MALARRRLPLVVCKNIASGVEDDAVWPATKRSFIATGCCRAPWSTCRSDQSTVLFGRSYANPFGISPTGVARIFRRDAELMLAQAASAANVPFVMSSASMVSIERVARVNPANTWFQLYAARDPKISDDFLHAHDAASFGTLMLTVRQSGVAEARARLLRNESFQKPRQARCVEFARGRRCSRPRGSSTISGRAAYQSMETWVALGTAGRRRRRSRASSSHTQNPSVQTWRDLDGFRRARPGKLVVKGIMRPSDAVRCATSTASTAS